VFIAVMFGLQWWQSRHIERGPAPGLAGPALDGRWLSLEQGRGNPTLVYFWATWCPVCRLEQGAIDDLAEDYPVITVATRSGDAQALSAYLNEHALSFPVVLDETGVLAERWGVKGVPASFVIDSRGEIRHAVFGLSTGLGLRARLWLVD
jgi:peroxiredoxin